MTIATFITVYFFAVRGWALFWAIQLTHQSLIVVKKLLLHNLN